MIKKDNSLQADLWLLLCTFLWGATFVAVRDSMRYVSPLTWLGLRFLLAGIILLPLGWRSLASLSAEGWRDGLVLGLFLFGGFALQTAGLVHTTASRSAFITGMAVVLVPPTAIALLRAKLDAWQVLGVALAAAGLYFLSRPTAGGFNRGDLLTALCAACFAVEVVLVQKYTQRHGPMAMVMVQIVVTIGLSGLLIMFLEKPRLAWSNTLIVDIFVTSVLATAGSLVIQFYHQRRTTPARAAIIYTMEPVFAAGFAYIILDERMPRLAWLGAALILVGMVVAEMGKLAAIRPLGVPPLGAQQNE